MADADCEVVQGGEKAWSCDLFQSIQDGEEITPASDEDHRVIFTDDRGLHHLVILNAQPEDEGEYALVAVNPLGEARTEGSLGIIRPRFVLNSCSTSRPNLICFQNGRRWRRRRRTPQGRIPTGLRAAAQKQARLHAPTHDLRLSRRWRANTNR